MELSVDKRKKEGQPLGTADLGVASVTDPIGSSGGIHAGRRAVDPGREAGEEVHEVELDPTDIEILLTRGHYDDCCIS